MEEGLRLLVVVLVVCTMLHVCLSGVWVVVLEEMEDWDLLPGFRAAAPVAGAAAIRAWMLPYLTMWSIANTYASKKVHNRASAG